MTEINWQTPLIIALLALVVFFWARYKSGQPLDLGEVRLVPYVGIMFLALLTVILCISYVVTKLKGL